MATQQFNPLYKKLFETKFLRKLKKIVIHNPLDTLIEKGDFLKANVTNKNYVEFQRTVKNTKFVLKVDKPILDTNHSFKVVWYNKGLGEGAFCELICRTDSNNVVYPKQWENTTKTDIIGTFDKLFGNNKVGGK